VILLGAYAARTLSIEIYLLAMLLEEHKEVMRLRRVVGEVFVPHLSGEECASSLAVEIIILYTGNCLQ
jgi:hypothetical protein